MNSRPIAVSIQGAAEHLGLSTRMIERLIAAGAFPKPRKIGAHTARYLVRELEEWAESLPESDILPPPNCGKRKDNVEFSGAREAG